MKKLYCLECSAYLEGGDGECKDCHCGWKQPMEEEKQSTPEQLQEENEKLKEVLFAGAFLMAKAVHKYDFGVGMEEQATDFMKDAEELTGNKLPKFA
ncbi:hypothetical protein [Proteus mirabilis]|uniref:hypothetical protein n=1 Tax=Proteus mirabilis TaxID=584 RepID=UPI0023606433|nr:hypothetical protein [Proteus mirabilis]MDC9765964.1 hypothetical protein [Proteus mirabilis]